MSDKLTYVKMAINFAAGVGVSKVVNDIITNNVTIETSADTAKAMIGTVVIGSMVSDAGSKHVNAKVDKVADWWREHQSHKSDQQS